MRRAAGIATAGCFLLFAASSSGAGGPSGQSASVHETCPKVGRHAAKSHEPDANTVMIPTGARSVLLCRYHGLNPQQRYAQLDRARLVQTPTTVRGFVNKINALEPFPVVTTCPRDDATKVVAFFRFSAAREVPIVIELSGCGGVSNGSVVREAIRTRDGRTFLARIDALTR
jgi:hypothetical protein